MKRQNKLGFYLAVTAGIGCVSSVANAATIVTLFGPDNVGPFAVTFIGGVYNYTIDGEGHFIAREEFLGDVFIFGRDTVEEDLDINGFGRSTSYVSSLDGFINGAIEGDNNFAFVGSFLDDGPSPLGIAQFNFDGEGGGFVVAIASNDDGTNLSFVDGVAAIQAAQVPEPSSLALLALGSLGLAARRNRRKSA